MPRVLHALPIVAALLVAAPLPAQTIINFDDRADGTVLTNQYSGVTFSSTPGFANYVTTQSQFNGSKPNFICTGPVGSEINCTAPTFIAWVSAVSGVKISAMGVNNVGVIARAIGFAGSTMVGSIDIVGADQQLNPLVVDLSGFGNITRLELVNITDGGGLGWDDLTYTSASVPEPSSAALLGIGLVAGIAARRKRRA